MALGVLLGRASVPNPTFRSDRPGAYLAYKSIKVQVTGRLVRDVVYVPGDLYGE